MLIVSNSVLDQKHVEQLEERVITVVSGLQLNPLKCVAPTSVSSSNF